MNTTDLKRPSDGLRLHSKSWKVNNAKFNICLLHGLGEHSGRYTHVAEFLNTLDANVFALDFHGHGQSEGARGSEPNLESFLDDVQVLVDHMKSDAPNLPWIFFAHSMGGNVTLNYILKRKPDCSAVITTSPWMILGTNPSKGLVMIANLVNKIGGFTQSSDIDPSYISTDAVEVEKYITDSLNHGKISSKAGMALYYSGQYLYNYKGEMPIPTLILQAKEDRLISAEGAMAFAKNNPKNVKLHLYDTVYHEMHYDVKREELFSDIRTWISDLNF